MNDLVSGMLVMNMDIYKQFDVQDENTGAIKKQWHYYETVPCYVKGIISNSATSRGGDKETFGQKYGYQQFLEVRTVRKLTIREKVTNISNKLGETIYEELNYPTNTPTVFEVTGTVPITDPFGQILGYNSTIKRSENQVIGD
jgi:hypothetical protein